MLYELTVENVALLEHVRISFHRGLNVLTGETGAGKSILVDALLLLLGGRGDRELIRTGTDKAIVEGAFTIDRPALRGRLAELGVLNDTEEEDVLYLSREYTEQGRSICRINGRMSSLTLLREVGETLVDIHGQHEHQSLLNPKAHLDYLDGYAGFFENRANVAVLYHKWRALEREKAAGFADPGERARRMDILAFQIEEIEKAAVKPGEEEQLRRERELARHEQRIDEILESAHEQLYVGGRGDSALDMISRVVDELEEIAALDPMISKLHEQTKEVYYQLEDATTLLRDVRSRRDGEPIDIDDLESRLELLSNLKRKYGGTLESVLEFAQNAKLEYEQLDTSAERLARLEESSNAARKELDAACATLHEQRTEAAGRLESAVMEELAQLGMAKTRFAVVFEVEEPTERGCDAVAFYIAPNVGETLKPLHRTASGGELSRMMLALKTIGAGEVDCLIFDEIDTGISGRTAGAVADKMAVIAGEHQVLCITHLPQIAAMADMQFLIEKQVEGERTHTLVKQLEEDGRVRMLAQMAGGTESAVAIEHAAEMRKSANQRKQELRK